MPIQSSMTAYAVLHASRLGLSKTFSYAIGTIERGVALEDALFPSMVAHSLIHLVEYEGPATTEQRVAHTRQHFWASLAHGDCRIGVSRIMAQLDYNGLLMTSTLLTVIKNWESEFGVNPPVLKPNFCCRKNLQEWARVLVLALIKRKFGWFKHAHCYESCPRWLGKKPENFNFLGISRTTMYGLGSSEPV